jgi:hypothetical protein
MSIARMRLVHGAVAALLALTTAVVTTDPVGAAGAVKGDPADALETYDRDVYVIVGSTLRNPDATTAADAPLFNVAGVSLSLTWGQFQAATGTSNMRVAGGRTSVDLVLRGLVPNGVYSVFYGTLTPDSENPLCPGVERALPYTSVDRRQVPDASSFVARADGTATYSGRVSGNLLSALQVFVELVYHFDGQTYGALPNRGEWLTQGQATCRSSFGEDAMRQLLVLQKW